MYTHLKWPKTSKKKKSKHAPFEASNQKSNRNISIRKLCNWLNFRDNPLTPLTHISLKKKKRRISIVWKGGKDWRRIYVSLGGSETDSLFHGYWFIGFYCGWTETLYPRMQSPFVTRLKKKKKNVRQVWIPDDKNLVQ